MRAGYWKDQKENLLKVLGRSALQLACLDGWKRFDHIFANPKLNLSHQNQQLIDYFDGVL